MMKEIIDKIYNIDKVKEIIEITGCRIKSLEGLPNLFASDYPTKYQLSLIYEED